MKRAAWIAAMALCVGNLGHSQPEAEVRWKAVPYDGLAQEIANLRGKVAVVDFWNHTCKHCLDNFPRLTQMQRKFAAQGLAVVTVSVDSKDNHGRAAAALKKQNMAATLNLLLDEDIDVWQKKIPIGSLPAVYLFDRRGQWTRFEGKAERELSYDDVEAAVQQLLQEK